jgi:hypothetical protein
MMASAAGSSSGAARIAHRPHFVLLLLLLLLTLFVFLHLFHAHRHSKPLWLRSRQQQQRHTLHCCRYSRFRVLFICFMLTGTAGTDGCAAGSSSSAAQAS